MQRSGQEHEETRNMLCSARGNRERIFSTNTTMEAQEGTCFNLDLDPAGHWCTGLGFCPMIDKIASTSMTMAASCTSPAASTSQPLTALAWRKLLRIFSLVAITKAWASWGAYVHTAESVSAVGSASL